MTVYLSLMGTGVCCLAMSAARHTRGHQASRAGAKAQRLSVSSQVGGREEDYLAALMLLDEASERFGEAQAHYMAASRWSVAAVCWFVIALIGLL